MVRFMNYFKDRKHLLNQRHEISKIHQIIGSSNGYLTRHLELTLQESLYLRVFCTSLKLFHALPENFFYLSSVSNKFLLQREIYIQTRFQVKLIYAVSWFPNQNFKLSINKPSTSLGWNLSQNPNDFKSSIKKIQFIRWHNLYNSAEEISYPNSFLTSKNCILLRNNQIFCILQEVLLFDLLDRCIR